MTAVRPSAPAVRVRRREPDGLGLQGTALMLPGRAYPCSRPLLDAVTTALTAAGWAVLQAEWELDGLPAEPRVFVESAAELLLRAAADGAGAAGPGGGLPPDLPVVLVGKSLGTLAAPWAADRGLPGAWLTPVLRAVGAHPVEEESRALVTCLEAYPAASVVVAGDADPWWRVGFAPASPHVEVVELASADHGLEGGDPAATRLHHLRAAGAVAALAGRVAGGGRPGEGGQAGS